MGLRLRGAGTRIRWRIVIGTGMLLGCLVPIAFVYRYFNVCAAPSAAALKEFPTYGGARLVPRPNPSGSPEDCGAAPIFTSEDTDRILAYYRGRLAAQGWALLPEYTETNESMTYRSVMGLRGGLCYIAGVEQYQGADPPSTKGLSVSVRNPTVCRYMQQRNPVGEPPAEPPP